MNNYLMADISEIIERYRSKKGIVIPLLQEVQELYGYVPKEAVFIIAKELSLHPVNIYSILTFYSQFYTAPRGKNTVRVCLGTACHVMGSKELLNFFEQKLNVKEGETSKDGSFTLERVVCLGCCGMAPVVTVNDNFYGRCEIKKADDILQSYRESEK
jgi:NADH-quinone oxidoreductase E subunit